MGRDGMYSLEAYVHGSQMEGNRLQVRGMDQSGGEALEEVNSLPSLGVKYAVTFRSDSLISAFTQFKAEDHRRHSPKFSLEFGQCGHRRFGLGAKGQCHDEGLFGDIIAEFYGPPRWKELSKEMSSKILPCGDGSCWKMFKPIVSLIVNGKLK
nr:hypothetical protein [Tanacetum cinerariifolium]